jgi:putative effector of murein hydrolase
LIPRLLGATGQILATIAPKSVTAGIAIRISEKIGGLPSLTAVLVIMTGITGAVIGSGLLRLIHVSRHDLGGFARGVASHGIGTARALQISEEAGAFAGLGMGLNGILTSFVLPIIYPILSGFS